MYIPHLYSTLLLKNASRHLSLQQLIIFLLVEGLASMLMVADGSLKTEETVVIFFLADPFYLETLHLFALIKSHSFTSTS